MILLEHVGFKFIAFESSLDIVFVDHPLRLDHQRNLSEADSSGEGPSTGPIIQRQGGLYSIMKNKKRGLLLENLAVS